MKKQSFFALTAAMLLAGSMQAQNPYLPLWEHVPDGEPRVFEDPNHPGKLSTNLNVYTMNNHYQLGGDYRMRFDYRKLFMGTKFAIFNYCTKKSGGYIDVDWFHYEH